MVLRSSGTLLTRPALYFFFMPTNSRGFGNWPSSWNLHLESWIIIGCLGASGMKDELVLVVDMVMLLDLLPLDLILGVLTFD